MQSVSAGAGANIPTPKSGQARTPATQPRVFMITAAKQCW